MRNAPPPSVAPRPADLLRALDAGRTVWLPAAGNSLWPLIRGGDLLCVLRGHASELSMGDIAVLDGPVALVAHIVRRVAPVATSSIVGVPDPPWPVLGRVVAVRRRGRRVPLSPLFRPLWRLAPWAAVQLKRSRTLRSLVHALRDR